MKEYLRKTRKLLETKLYRRNLIKGINTRAIRYSGPLLKRTREELKQMDQRTRKLMTMHRALHPRNKVDRLYVSRKEGERGLASIEDSIDASIQRFEDYIGKHEGGLKFDHTNKWYMHNPASVLKNETHKLLWDFEIQTDHLISVRRPDLIIIRKKNAGLWTLLSRLTTE